MILKTVIFCRDSRLPCNIPPLLLCIWVSGQKTRVYACPDFLSSYTSSSVVLFPGENVTSSCHAVLVWCQSSGHRGTWVHDPRQANSWRLDSTWPSQNRKGELLDNAGETGYKSLLPRSQRVLLAVLLMPGFLTVYLTLGDICVLSMNSLLLFICTRVGSCHLLSSVLISAFVGVWNLPNMCCW